MSYCKNISNRRRLCNLEVQFHSIYVSLCLFVLKVIPVAIGTDADPNELEKVTSNRQNMIKSPKSEEAKSLGKKIIKTIVKGNAR